MEYAFKTQPWLYAGDSAWVFASVPAKYYEEIKLTASSNRGFGAVRVNASCNNVKWQTSIFPDSKTKTYLLPIKKSIRAQANIDIGNTVSIVITLIY